MSVRKLVFGTAAAAFAALMAAPAGASDFHISLGYSNGGRCYSRPAYRVHTYRSRPVYYGSSYYYGPTRVYRSAPVVVYERSRYRPAYVHYGPRSYSTYTRAHAYSTPHYRSSGYVRHRDRVYTTPRYRSGRAGVRIYYDD